MEVITEGKVKTVYQGDDAEQVIIDWSAFEIYDIYDGLVIELDIGQQLIHAITVSQDGVDRRCDPATEVNRDEFFHGRNRALLASAFFACAFLASTLRLTACRHLGVFARAQHREVLQTHQIPALCVAMLAFDATAGSINSAW